MAKQESVEEIKGKLAKAKSIVILNYQGLNVTDSTKLREEFRKNNGEYKVYKNRLILRALNELNIAGFDEVLQGNTSIAISYEDEVSAPKIAYNAMKTSTVLSVKGGIVNGKAVEISYIEKLSKLPSKDVLIAQLLGMLQAPVRNLACVLQQVSEKN